VDDRDYVRNGAKYFEWERKGVPLRIELGPRDVKGGVCVFKYRVGKEDKETISLGEAAAKATEGLGELQCYLLETAEKRLEAGINHMSTYELEKDEASNYDGPGLYLVPWKCDAVNEEKIKEECKATIRCYPTDVNEAGMWEGKKCFYSGEDATHMALFGRAF
jgi:prolyl-tRNA synthetase